MSILIVDYGMGNLHSVSKALEISGADVVVSSNPDDLKEADAIVLPGVGSFAQGMTQLRDLNLIDGLTREVMFNQKPFLGICLGMHLVAKTGEEGGLNKGLGWIDAQVVRLNSETKQFKLPHIGWDEVRFLNQSSLFSGLNPSEVLYFVHSFHFIPQRKDIITAVCNYGRDFVAAVSMGNINLVQFHPEKSQEKGLRILENFVSIIKSSGLNGKIKNHPGIAA